MSQTNSILVTLNLAYFKAGFSFCVSPVSITDEDASVCVYVPVCFRGVTQRTVLHKYLVDILSSSGLSLLFSSSHFQ